MVQNLRMGHQSHRPGSLDGVGVCLVGINYSPDSTGIAPYNTAMAEAFRDAGADVHVVTGIPHYPEWKVKDKRYARGSRWEQIIDGIQVTRLRHHVPPETTLVGRARMEASFLSGAVRVVRRDTSDIVIAVTPSLAGLAAGVYGKKGRPLGVLVQDLTGNAAGESGTTGGRASRAIAAYEYSLLRKAELVGVITPQFGAVLQSHGVPTEQIMQIPNFTHITPSTATREEARARLGWPLDEYLVVHTGNMGMKQGLETVVDAAKHSDVHGLGITFLLIGDGNQRVALEAKAPGIKSVRFINPLSAEDYPLALAAADALLLNERQGVKEMSMPSKLTSYTSARRPIIAGVEPGGITHSVITAENAALVVEPGNPRELVAAAVSLAENADLASALTTRAHAMHESRYSASTARTRYVHLAEALGGIR